MNDKKAKHAPEKLPAEYQKIAEALREMDRETQVPDAFCSGWRAAVERDAQQMKQMKEKKRFSPRPRWQQALAVAAAVVFLFAGTAITRSVYPGASTNSSPSYAALPTPAPMMRASGADSRESGVMLAAEAPAAYVEESFAVNDIAYEEAEYETGATQRRVLLRTAHITINTTSYEDDLRAVMDTMRAYQGWSEYESSSGEPAAPYGSGSGRRASLTLRIPAESLDAFLEDVQGIGVVKSMETSAEDVSSNYYDVKSRVAIYEAQRERLTELLNKAETMADIIEIENSLTDLQYRIESLQGSLNHWDSYANASVVNLSLREIAVVEDSVQAGLLERLGDALVTSLYGAAAFFSDMLIFLTLALPYLAVLAVVVVIVRISARRWKKRRAKKAFPEEINE